MQKVKKFLLLLLFTTIATTTLFLLVFVPFIEQFTDLPALTRMNIESRDCLENFTLLFPIYTYKNEPLRFIHLDLRPGSIKNYSISIVETEYGKMWEIKIEKINRSGGIVFAHVPMEDFFDPETMKKTEKIINESDGIIYYPYYAEPMNLFDLELKPVLNESFIKDEQIGRHYQKVSNITIPVYIYYEGNVTEVRITFDADSGLDNFLGLIPVAPKHNGKVYSGHRDDEFVIRSKGWGNVTGTSIVYLVYQ